MTRSQALTVGFFGIALLASAAARSASLVDAAEHADWAKVTTLLSREATDASKSQPDGMTALHWATHHGSQETVKRLLEAGAEPNAATAYHVRALSIACQNGHAAIAKRLLEAGANPGTTLAGGETPLMTAARTGDAEIVRLLIKHQADVNATEANGQTALMWAASAGHASLIDILAAAGADLEATSRQGFTALHFAARDGRAEVATKLIDAGSKINAVMQPKNKGGRAPRDGMSPLLLAVESGHFELALGLVRHGADPNDQRSGYAPLHALSWVRKANLGDNPTGDPEPRGSGSVTSLQFVRQLAASGADINLRIRDNKQGVKQLKHEGATPLLFAARTADLALMRVLTQLGADPLTPNEQGCTPLMACAGVGVQGVGEEAGTEPEVLASLTFLLGLGADPNTIDDNRETAMHGAAYRNFPRVVELLAAHGADPAKWNHKNRSGWTPMRIAEGYRPGSFKPHPETQQALRAALAISP